ncbi:PREDICTED: transformation/transcription domain-associated protein isoform X2 [Nicrophorus vespilloides]|uniref:Transformation/transcription domain-associated protein isoform X2 n=1 Tax=Nicrophorus vespilloides TaxID=110193 RepID=A0ABM1MSY3_NICVS|nr:PREDICTED: transformation/transcription domain-associated protein isoform X2 [Nicrophorus vespilloides]
MMKTNMQATTSAMSTVDSSTAQMNKFRSYINMLVDPAYKDDIKLKAIQEISENFETILSSSMYASFLEHSIKIFLSILQEGEPHFIAEYNIQQVRKLILEILHRLPTNDLLKPYVKPIVSLTLKLLEIDNEENVLVCLKIIIELHKMYRPAYNSEIHYFLQFVKTIYSELPTHMSEIFEPRAPIKVKDLAELNIDELLKETFTITSIQTEKRNNDQTLISYNLIPKAVLSLKVIQELPIIVVLMYQLYKQNVHQDVSDFIPLIMKTIVLQPSPQQRQAESFNKEIFVDFMGAQIKTLSFLAYIIKIYQEGVATHSSMLVQGILGLLTLCPMEVAHLRKELLIASRHILATDLRNKFVPQMEKLFDEQVLLGKGWTTHESLRPLAYSTLADLVHHVRQQLNLADIARAVHLFGKIVHDDSLATTIQTMSCKLLLNLVECIRKKAEIENSSEGRGLLMRMLEVFVLKFKTIAKIQLPKMTEKCKQQAANPQPSNGIDGEGKLESLETVLSTQKEEKSKFGFPQPTNYNVSEYRSLVKTLVCGVKTITWGCSACKIGINQPPVGAKQFQPHETLVFIRLVKWALKALDIYTLAVGGPPVSGPARLNQQNVRNKEEKEVLEHFSSFSMMHPQTFHEIFSTTIEYVVERVYKNATLQIVPNTLLANPTTSPIFATVLVEYLLERMEEMGSNQDRSNLYLKLFKLVFGSVSLFPQENENMLRPHLHRIVNRSMELAMVAKEPYNYFLLLRALFRSIGGGSHDLLYQEFLPLLPNLLEGLNRLQSGLHKQHMKDLFVELCLTVPVRLSSLLPYLPMLMDPLVSALNGSHALISQGLRTLELCVDNLQHDFLYEHIQPVRADLMQALWRTLRNNDQVAQVAFKVLGKFGGGNRKMMIEPQKLEYVDTDYEPPAILAQFHDHTQQVEFPVEKVIETAFNALKHSSTDSYYRKQAWEVIYCYLTASLNLNDDRSTMLNLFINYSVQFTDENNIPHIKGSSYKSINKQARDTHQTALIGMVVAAAIKELSQQVLSTLVNIVQHYTIIAVAQQAGPFAITPRPNEQVTLDPLVLVDALAVIMGHEEKELIKPGRVALIIMLNTATHLLGSKDLACRLPLIEYMAEKMCGLCYERAWYAKLGGCHAIQFMVERCARKWVYEHMFTFLKALLFVMMDLTGEVSSGALDMAKNNLEKMLIVLVTPPPENADKLTRDVQIKALCKVTHELVRLVTSSHTMVREQAMQSLKLMAEKQNKTVTAVMEPFREVLVDMVPPKKHLLKHQPAIAQMGLMDGNMFCTTLNPRLFTIDMSIKEHNMFILDLISLCSTEDAKLSNLSCYKNITDFTPLRKSALRVLAACHYLEADVRENIFKVLYKTLEKPNAELQEMAFECMKSFIAGYQVEKEFIHNTMRPLLMTLRDVKTLTLNSVKMLSYLTQLFPNVFNEKLCDQLIEILMQLLENLVINNKNQADSTGISKKGEEEQKIVTVISFFYQTPSASSKFIKQLCQLVLQAEHAMLIEASSPFRETLMKFLLRYPIESLDLFMDDGHIKDKQYSRYLEYLIQHQDGKPFRDYIQTQMVKRLITLALANTHVNPLISETDRNEMQYQAIRLIYLLIRKDEQWLSTQLDLIEALKMIWCNDEYQERHKAVEHLEYNHWREPKMLVKILLHFFCHHPNNIDLLFQLLRALCDRFIPEFQFLKDFLENTVAQHYTVEWKRSAFFLFVEQFPMHGMSQELKAKVLQLVLIPCFAVSFERGETNKLIGTLPAPYTDNPENIVSVFINKLIDPDNPFPFADCVRISLLQFSCLLVEQASPHIHDHDAHNKAQGYKLRRLMTFAWPCLLGKNCVDAATRYHGHLLLSHIIDKYAIHRKIVIQVFYSLLKAHGFEARNVVRQALEILTPSMPLRMEEGNKMLTHWTKKIIVDEGHSMQQLFHILQLVVKHYKVYYPVRHNLVQHMVNSIQRLGFNPSVSFEHRKLAVELCEVIIKWELYGIREDIDGEASTSDSNVKRTSEEEQIQRKRLAFQSGEASGSTPTPLKVEQKTKPIDRVHTDAVLNYLLRFACQVSDPPTQTPTNPTGSTPGEILSRRCVALLKMALKPDVWPQPIDLKLGFFDKILQSADQLSPNIGSICTALELLTFLLMVLKKEQILANFKPLQRGIGACITSSNNKIVRYVHTLLHKLMGLFPTERTNTNMSCKYEELEILYSTVGKVIFEGLTNYEKNLQATVSSLYGTLMILKAACLNNNSYIDLLITPFMKVLNRIAKEHLQPTLPEASPNTSEMLILSLDLVKTRVVVMGVEMRKTFIGSILVGLIEKTQDLKVMKAIVKMLEEWMKNKNVITLSQAPSLREKSILLVKLMQYVEKRFADDQELNAQFLELINYVYTDEHLKQTELSAKLEPAFLAGLRCNQPHIRAKFFKVFDESMRKRLHDRLLYITSTQNWDAIGPHYWIKQCIELLIATANSESKIQMSHESSILPNITSVINLAEAKKREEFYAIKQENPDVFVKSEVKEEAMDMDLTNVDSNPNTDENSVNFGNVMKIINKQHEFLESCKTTTSHRFLMAAAQLCHMDTQLAEQVWLQMFPKLWSILDERQRNRLTQDILPFITSGTHIVQKDCHPSAVNTFVEALSRCNPTIQISPPLMQYIGKSHNLWHRMALGLEQMAFDQNVTTKSINTYELENGENPKKEIYDCLGQLYAQLCEEDLWAGLWQRHAYYKETSIAIMYEQHGLFEQAQTAYENAMLKHKQDNNTNGPPPMYTQREVLLWTDHWIRCAKELKQWDILSEYSKAGVYDPYLMLESAWRIPNWEQTKEALSNVEYNCPKELPWKVTLYGGYLLICHPEERNLKLAERYVETASSMCLQEWRRLPYIVSHIHLQYLQAAQQIMELQEAYKIRKGLQQGHQNSLHEMKAIVKTWRNRLPVIADDLTHWNDIFTWRQHHYEFIIKHYEKNDSQAAHHNNSMLGVHASARSIIHFGKIARKHKLTNVCLESLNRIYSIPSVPIVDCFQKIRQQIKCLLQQASVSNKNDYMEGLEVINKANVAAFGKEMNAEFYALKGLLYHLSGKSDEANKAFSAAVQMQDTWVKAWALYGDYLEHVFTRDPRQISLGVNSITCFLHACRHQNESKARKYLAKVLWLLSYDDDNNSLTDALDKYSVGVPPLLWLPWTPQLLNCLVQYDAIVFLNLLLQVGKMFPQAVYFPIRTLYLTLRTAAARKTNTAQQTSQGDNHDQSGQEGGSSSTTMESTIKATPPMVRCSKIMKMQRDIHTTVLTSLEGIADQMEWFRENWYEEVVRQLRQGLAKCYAIAFENRESVNEAKITPHIVNFIKKLVSTFGIGVENINSSANVIFHSAASESLARRAEATYQDPVFQEMKSEFTKDFDFSQTNALRLRILIFKLKKWIKILENRSKILIQSFLIEEKCRFLSNFTLKTAEVELPGEFLLPKHTHYYVKITRFMPRVDIVQKHNTAARRLYIRGHNGKIYPYLVVNDSGLADARREERVLQLLRMMNHYLARQKESARRFLHFTVPRVVAVSQQIRLVEDNVASISLLDIFKKGCAKLNIEHDAPINYYYERLANVQGRGLKTTSHQVYRDILKGIQTNMVPRTMLRQWALSTFPSATDYWQFRKMFTLQLALACFSEYVLHLTRLNPDMMYLHQDSGLVNISYFKFDVNDSTGELDITRPVQFRLTPNIIEYVSSNGINGPLTATMIAAARCFVYPNFKVSSILKPILRDEMVLSRLKKADESDANKEEKLTEGEQIINMVNKAVTSINNRMNTLAHFDGTESKVNTLVAAASSHDNLCRMDPAWHPWF